MGNKDQTKWSQSYSMRYSHDISYKNNQQVFMLVLTYWFNRNMDRMVHQTNTKLDTFILSNGGFTIFQITGNQNGFQASTTNVHIYNVRHVKIQSTGSSDFCLRIELCGEGKHIDYYCYGKIVCTIHD